MLQFALIIAHQRSHNPSLHVLFYTKLSIAYVYREWCTSVHKVYLFADRAFRNRVTTRKCPGSHFSVGGQAQNIQPTAAITIRCFHTINFISRCPSGSQKRVTHNIIFVSASHRMVQYPTPASSSDARHCLDDITYTSPILPIKCCWKAYHMCAPLGIFKKL